MERRPNAEAINSVTEPIDGATGDITMSGDAMRWSPELADGQVGAERPLPPAPWPGWTSPPGSARCSAWTRPECAGWCRGR